MRAVVVTGARGGIGEAAANEVLSLGDRVYGTGSSYDETSRVAATLPDPVAARLPARRRARVGGRDRLAVAARHRVDVV